MMALPPDERRDRAKVNEAVRAHCCQYAVAMIWPAAPAPSGEPDVPAVPAPPAAPTVRRPVLC
jgi:hypothetical protein